jgi:REP element-mobilizing transposase RayT
MSILKTSTSCKFLLLYHFIFVCKYRKNILVERFALILKNQMLNIAIKYDFTISGARSYSPND